MTTTLPVFPGIAEVIPSAACDFIAGSTVNCRAQLACFGLQCHHVFWEGKS